MNQINFEQKAEKWGLWIAAAAFALYAITLSDGFWPGPSAGQVAGFVGVQAFPPTMHHLWGWLVTLLAAIPVGSLAVRVHLLNAVCAATSVGLLYAIMIRLPREPSFEQMTPPRWNRRMRLFAALFAAVALAVATPFWIAATRAHALPLSSALMLAGFYQLIRYGEEGRLFRFYWAVALCSLGIVNYASMLLYMPIFGLVMLFYLFRFGELRLPTVLRAAGLGLSALLILVLAAWLYSRSPAYEWREFKHLGQVFWYMLRDQYVYVLKALPRVGWLTVALVSLLPWVAVFGMSITRRSITAGANFGTFLLAVIFTAVFVIVYLDWRISPWLLTRDQPLLISPYVLIAMWAGWVAAYWFGFLMRWPGTVGIAGSRVWALVAFGFLIFCGARNFSTASGQDGRIFANFAKQIVDRIGFRPYLLSFGYVDDLIALEAWQRGRHLSIINTRMGDSVAYRRYVASLFEEPRMKSLALVGLQPLIQEWFTRGKDVEKEVAIYDHGDIWLLAGRYPEPHGPLYEGRPPDSTPEPELLMEDNRQYWRSFADPAAAKSFPGTYHPAKLSVDRLLAVSAKSANNLGVAMEEHGRPDLAEECYRKALALNTNNISALVNLHALLHRQGRPEAEELAAAIESRIGRDDTRRYLWSLAYHQGHIRSPELYASRGWVWAMSGKPELAATDIRQALELGGPEQSLRLALATLDPAQDRGAATEEFFKEELKKNPQNVEAAFGLYRLAVSRGRLDEARLRLDYLSSLNVSSHVVRVEEALLDALEGRVEQAASALTQVIAERPDYARAWAAMVLISALRSDARALRDAVDATDKMRAVSPGIRFLVANVALQQGELATAKRQLELLLQQDPRNAPALELLMRVLLAERDRAGAEALLDRLIAVDPRNAFGNYFLGAFQTLRGQYEMAESSYRVSLERRRTPEALNDLAYVLARQKRFKEALPLIEEALRLREAPPFWHTYGYVLIGLERYEEAERALTKAATESAVHPDVLFSLARLYEKRGRFKEALEMAESAMPRIAELLKEDQDELRELIARLRSRG